ncbi:MAG: hypothetical protein K2G13_02365 [Muribaculaceae bacterium]|nr:hypothetical protein [Muribaculaceae bacterium]
MERVRIDVLVIGSVVVESVCTWYESNGVYALGSAWVERNQIPQEFTIPGIVFDLRDAIIIRAVDSTPINIESVNVPKGKRLLATGCITVMCKTPNINLNTNDYETEMAQ